MKTTLANRLVATARANTDRPAIADSTGCSLTYGQMLSQAQRIAGWLLGTRRGETNVGVYLPSSVPAAIANYGITLAGKTAVNLNFTAGQANCRSAIEKCELTTILTTREFLTKFGIEAATPMVCLEDLSFIETAELPQVSPDTTACILFSSGSTGVPKGIELTHWNIVANANGLASRIPLSPDDCVLGVLPFFHSFGYTFALWFPVLHGIRAVYHSTPTDAKTIGQLAETHRATYFFSTPTFCQQYASKVELDEFASLKYVIVGAEKLRDSVARQFRDRFGIELLAGYGCTELGPGVAINTPRESKAGSVGRPLDGIQVRIADLETLAPLPASREGIILVNGPSRMPGYYKAPEMTANAIQDGFYVTGDIGFVDEDGFLYVTDRIARFSKIAGEMVPHLQIEEAINDLTQSFVTGLPDERRGERLILLYTNQNVTSAELYTRLRESQLPRLWIPKHDDIYRVAAIPVLANGKVDLKGARELAASVAGLM